MNLHSTNNESLNDQEEEHASNTNDENQQENKLMTPLSNQMNRKELAKYEIRMFAFSFFYFKIHLVIYNNNKCLFTKKKR